MTITAAGAIAAGASYSGGIYYLYNSVALYNSLATGYALNQGGITGRPSRHVPDAYVQAGIGVAFSAGIFTNAGTVTGGAGHRISDGGGTGVYLKGAGTLLNTGVIYGGAGSYLKKAGNGLQMTGGYGLNAAGAKIIGGSYPSGYAGYGVYIEGGTFINHGAVSGGFANFQGGIVVNHGTITGGIDGGYGFAADGGTLIN